MSREDWKRSLPAWLRGTALGFPFGTIPAGGSEIPTFLSYSVEKKLGRESEGGAIERVAGPEAANNSAAMGVLVPLLTLGIPTSATAAILLGAFQNYGLQPGPLLFQSQASLVWGLVASLYVGNVMLLVLNLPLVPLFAQVLRAPAYVLYPLIVGVSMVGVYSASTSLFDVGLLAGFGLLGYLMRKLDYPAAPLILGMVLGGAMERALRQSLMMSGGDLGILVTRPIAATMLCLALLILAVPLFARLNAWRLQAMEEEK
jgi:putative tricarboxylic transport membrane protein